MLLLNIDCVSYTWSTTSVLTLSVNIIVENIYISLRCLQGVRVIIIRWVPCVKIPLVKSLRAHKPNSGTGEENPQENECSCLKSSIMDTQ